MKVATKGEGKPKLYRCMWTENCIPRVECHSRVILPFLTPWPLLIEVCHWKPEWTILENVTSLPCLHSVPQVFKVIKVCVICLVFVLGCVLVQWQWKHCLEQLQKTCAFSKIKKEKYMGVFYITQHLLLLEYSVSLQRKNECANKAWLKKLGYTHLEVTESYVCTWEAKAFNSPIV